MRVLTLGLAATFLLACGSDDSGGAPTTSTGSTSSGAAGSSTGTSGSTSSTVSGSGGNAGNAGANTTGAGGTTGGSAGSGGSGGSAGGSDGGVATDGGKSDAARDAIVGDGPSQARQTARPIGMPYSKNGFWEYLPPGYGDGTLRPLLVF